MSWEDGWREKEDQRQTSTSTVPELERPAQHRQSRQFQARAACALQVTTVSQTDVSTPSTKWPEQRLEASLLIYMLDTDLCPTWTLEASASLEENNW